MASTVVTEAALQSGSLITARLAAEQGKQVFAVPSLIDNKNAEGCHHLIREGATLIYHPDQILEDIQGESAYTALPKTFSRGVSAFSDEQASSEELKLSTKAEPFVPVVPNHLALLISRLGSEPKDLDALVASTGMDTGSLLAQLMELELLGLVAQAGGRYVRT